MSEKKNTPAAIVLAKNPQAIVSMAGSNPDRVIGTITGAGIVYQITERDAGRAASNTVRKLFASSANAEMLATAVIAGLISMVEINELSGQMVAVRIALRKRGALPLIVTLPAEKSTEKTAEKNAS